MNAVLKQFEQKQTIRRKSRMTGQVTRPQVSARDAMCFRQPEKANALESFGFAKRYKKVTRMSLAFLEVLEDLHCDLRDRSEATPALTSTIEDSVVLAEITDQLAEAIAALTPLARADRREPFSV